MPVSVGRSLAIIFNVSVLAVPFGLPEFIAVAVVIVLHVWKRNNLLSIGVGTALYMFLIQVVF